MVVSYVAFSTINTLPSYWEGTGESTMRLAAWQASGRLIDYLQAQNSINDTALSNLTGCVGYNYNNISSRENYTRVRAILGAGESSQIRIVIEQFPVAVLDAGNSTERNGAVAIGNASYNVSASKGGSFAFNLTRVSGGPWTPAGAGIDIAGAGYIVAGIGAAGDAVIFKRTLLDCGPSMVSSENRVEVVRYTTYRGNLARITVVYA